jgi:putative tricarboxylic transport membrane protein
LGQIDRIVGIGAIALGIVLAFLSWRLDLGDWRMPGPGAWPFFLGVALALIGGWLFFRPQPPIGKSFFSTPRWGRLAIGLGTLFGYVLILEPLGYILATALVLFVQLHWVENRRWTTSVLTAVLAAVISFWVFGLCLKVLLPAGIVPIRAGV